MKQEDKIRKPRNYKKEYAKWKDRKYKQYHVALDQETASRLDKFLKERKQGFSDFIRSLVEEKEENAKRKTKRKE